MLCAQRAGFVIDMPFGIVFRGLVVCSELFFFKQKTAYEMRISDWSSDVCSSDLLALLAVAGYQNRDKLAEMFGGGGRGEPGGTGQGQGDQAQGDRKSVV